MAVIKNIKKAAKILSCLVIVLSILTSSMVVFAEDPYHGYNYNYYGEASAPNGYLPTEAYNGFEWGVGYLKSPSDMYVDVNNELYILDAGNSRIIILDETLSPVKVIDSFTDVDGSATQLKNPQGICVTPDGEIYVCDTDNSRVVIMDRDGQFIRSYGKPESDLLSETFVFKPKKVEVTATGDMYILADNIVDGALIIAENGEFGGFFATDAVTVTADILKILFYRLFMSEEQIAKMMSIQPVPFDNMYLDGDFLYTATLYLREEDQIRKVNPAGNNLFAGNMYGEAYVGGTGGGYEQAAFIDVNVSEKGFVYALDRNFCKVFVYNQDNELLMIFGGNEQTLGQYTNPVAIETIGDTVMILDASKNNLTVLEPTYYGSQIMLGSYMYEHGEYEKALEPWHEVLKLNTNSELAYRGIARAEYLKGEYLQAQEHYHAAYDREGYSEAREKYRSQVIMKNFPMIMMAIIIIAAVCIIISRNKKKIYAKIGYKTLEETGYAGMAKWKYPFYNMLHPSVGMSEMRYNKKESLPLAILFAFLWYASAVIMRQYEDYIFNDTNVNNLNIFMIFATTIGILLVGCIANWAITTLVDGKGTFKNIFIYASYALIPSAIAAFIVTLLSQVMVSDEAIFVTAILFVGYAWTAILLFMGMMTVHTFTTPKTILMVLLTVVGMLIIVFLMMLLVVLYSQVSTFITTIMYELFYKLAI